jgi:hypothetical protein
VVVAAADGVGPAAKALALDLYADPDLRPSVDDATARVLAGEAPPEGAPPKLKEIAELRASIVRALTAPSPPPAAPGAPGTPASPPSDLVARRLLASLGTELGAVLVVPVSMDGTRPVARALRTGTATFERIELGPSVEIAPDGARTYRWPGAAATLHGLLPVVPPPPPAPAPPPLGPEAAKPAPPAPLAPKAEAAPAAPAAPASTPFYKSPWFWGSVGGAVAVGLGVFAISKATGSSSSNVHLMGKVGP